MRSSRLPEAGRPPRAICTMAGSRSMARWTFGSIAAPLTELRDGRLQRLQLRGEFAGGSAVAAVLDLQHVSRGLQLRDFRVRAPAQPEPDEHRQREQRQHCADRPASD